MNYSLHKRRFPKDVLVYIEEFDKQNKIVLFDFIDSNEYELFNFTIDRPTDFNKPSMVLLKNYRGKPIQANTIYSIRPDAVMIWQEQIYSTSENIDSFLIGAILDVSETEAEIFRSSVSLNKFDYWQLNYSMVGGGQIPISEMNFDKKGELSVTIRDVGQGNWNEISLNSEVKIVFDAGAPMNVPKKQVINIIGDRSAQYSLNTPILILSHWDKDHYHSLIGMSDNDLRNNFSTFICRDRIPNLTSRILFNRISNAIGSINIYAISSKEKPASGGPTFFENINPTSNQIVIYSAQYHKNRNISGLALSVKTAKKSIILSGDAHYSQISRDILRHLNYRHKHSLVVPHHGGKAGNYLYNTPPNVSLDTAIISTGANHYGHPLSTNIDALIKSGFVIKQTNSGGDRTVKL